MREPKTNLSDNVYFDLKNRIIRGELRSGTALKEESLAEAFQVSRTPLRKALTQLMSEGYLVKCPDRTLRIPEISLNELRHTLAVRKLLEVASTVEACSKATDTDIARLEFLIADEYEALKKRDTVIVSSLDRGFHEYLAKLSTNTVLMDFIGQLNCKVSFFLAVSNTLGDVISYALKEHSDILAALKEKSPERAGELMRLHLDNVESRIIESLTSQRERLHDRKESALS